MLLVYSTLLITKFVDPVSCEGLYYSIHVVLPILLTHNKELIKSRLRWEVKIFLFFAHSSSIYLLFNILRLFYKYHLNLKTWYSVSLHQDRTSETGRNEKRTFWHSYLRILEHFKWTLFWWEEHAACENGVVMSMH